MEGYEVDVAWLDHRLVVELDSHGYHGTRAAFEDDRVRDAILQAAGYRVIRITHRRLERSRPEWWSCCERCSARRRSALAALLTQAFEDAAPTLFRKRPVHVAHALEDLVGHLL